MNQDERKKCQVTDGGIIFGLINGKKDAAACEALMRTE